MKEVRIYKPAKTAMQSGQGKTKRWIISFGPDQAGYIDGRLGWYGTGDHDGQVRLSFETRDQAVTYAQSMGWHVVFGESPEWADRPPSSQSYSDNFAPTKRRFTVPS